VRYLETHIVDHCNLRCNGCSHFSSIAEPYYKDLGDFEKEMGRISNLFNLHTLRIMGGEPTLHPYAMSFCEAARSILPDTKIVFVTNGILYDKIDWDFLRLQAVEVCVSNYHLGNYKVTGNDFYWDEKGQMYNISLDLEGKQNADESFSRCDLSTNKWWFLKDGKIYPCCIGANIDAFNKHFGLNLEQPEGIDIFTHDAEEIREYLNKPIELCKRCNIEQRMNSYHDFSVSKGVIDEWTCP